MNYGDQKGIMIQEGDVECKTKQNCFDISNILLLWWDDSSVD